MEKEKIGRWERFRVWLTTAYRLVILNEESFGEKFSVKLSPLGLLIAAMAVTIVMTSLILSIIAFTPLREYIPGYGNISDRREILRLRNKADSIENLIEAKQAYLNNLINVFTENVESKPDKPKKDSLKNYKDINSKPSDADLKLRNEVEEMKSTQANTAYQSKNIALNELVFYTPVKGIVVTSFNVSEEHLGVDVVTKPEESIKSPLAGTIVYTGFTIEDGYIVHIQHGLNLVSIFKHNSKLLRKTGDRIKTGDVIGIVGNTGTTSKGPHVHYELWFNGVPVNPEEFLAF